LRLRLLVGRVNLIRSGVLRDGEDRPRTGLRFVDHRDHRDHRDDRYGRRGHGGVTPRFLLLLLAQACFVFLSLTFELLLPHPLLFLEARLMLAKLDVFTFTAGEVVLGAFLVRALDGCAPDLLGRFAPARGAQAARLWHFGTAAAAPRRSL